MRALVAALLGVLSLVAAGCGSGTGGLVADDGDKARGKALFTSQCASCHTLAEAKANGKVGPSLDASFTPDRKQGIKESTIRQVVADQIKFPGQYGADGPTMPADLVTGDDVDAVAAYVAYVAGCRKCTVTAASQPGTTTGTTPSGGGGDKLAAGKKAFADNGCASCHTLEAAGATGKVGPDLDKLPQYASDAGEPIEDFIRESITDPNAYVEKGFPKGVMPPFDSLPEPTLDALVALLSGSSK